MELFERIRRDSWREGLSVRVLARKYGVHRRLVREALTSAGRLRGRGTCGDRRSWSH